MSIVVLESALGYRIFYDISMYLEEDDDEIEEEVLNEIELISEFIFENPEQGAYITNAIEHSYDMPHEILGFIAETISKNEGKMRNAKWNFLSETLGQLVSTTFWIKWFYLNSNAQRFIYSRIAQFFNVTEEELAQATRKLACARYTEDTLRLASQAEVEYEEEVNEQEIAYLRMLEEENEEELEY